MNWFKVGGTCDSLNLFVVFPPSLERKDLYFSWVKINSKHLFFVEVSFLAGRAAQGFIFLISHQMLVGFHNFFLFVQNQLFSLHFLLLNYFFLLFLVLGKVWVNLVTDHLSFLEVFDYFEANQRYFSKFCSSLFWKSSQSDSGHSINLLQNSFIE